MRNFAAPTDLVPVRHSSASLGRGEIGEKTERFRRDRVSLHKPHKSVRRFNSYTGLGSFILVTSLVPGRCRGGSHRARGTSHAGELSFVAAVDQASDRVEVDIIGTTKQGRPLQLVRIGHPTPAPLALALRRPTTLFVCTQHGNEPAGREACLQRLRDLAFTDDAKLVAQLREQTILFVPTANPDGREANARGNSDGTDINRDHLNLRTPEGRAMAVVVRDWEPEAVVDLHEYGPSIPALYDDEVLVLWPRNLNVDQDVHAQAKKFALDFITKDEEEAGYSTDEYGMYEVADQDIHQSAGDGDEGIARNAMGAAAQSRDPRGDARRLRSAQRSPRARGGGRGSNPTVSRAAAGRVRSGLGEGESASSPLYVVRLARRVVAVGVEFEVVLVSSPLIRAWEPAVPGSSRVPARSFHRG